MFLYRKLVRLPEGSAVLAPPADASAVVSLPAMQRGFVTFGSLHRLDKITDATFDRWSKIIRSVDHSRLLVYWPTLHGARRDWMQSELIQRGITADRIDLRSDAGDDGYLSVYNEIDIGLDPTPWTGSTTTKEALWMGVAVLALYGHRRSSRGSAVVLNQIGLDELIVQSEGDYIEAAVRLAGDLPRLADLRASLRPRMQQRLQSAEAFTRVLESTYRQLWQDWCEN